ncbi:MAG: glutamyl-tRNA synthetase, glutamyl-tRNA synthetase [Parcubacteria group bacterium]|nr:glutamyl-tRNA synthetase, glutamyl-tRNA synthetase [Parcubacteria group bacterium]
MNEHTNNIVVRMAPSPTGNLHIGTARATLFNYLFAKKYGGKFILRSEDTDKERSKKEYEDNILAGLTWLGLTWDEFYRQSDRTEIYVSYVKKMLESGSAYISKEEPKEPGQRTEVVRFKNPNKKIAFDDLIRGTVEFDTTELGDFIIARSPEEPLYHLAVVVDDFEMKVTHVMRGEDHISNTPRQILIQEAIGAPRPVYAHLPLIFDAEHKKLSKRKHGAMVWIDTYKEEGYLPDALLNFFAFMGWNPGTEREIFTLPELVEAFTIERVQKGAAVFNIEKLKWFQKKHIELLPAEEQLKFIAKDFDMSEPVLDKEKIAWKQSTPEEARKNLETVLPMIDDEAMIMAYAEEAGKGNVLWPLRYALSGKEKSPDPFTLMKILGKEESAKRIQRALELL